MTIRLEIEAIKRTHLLPETVTAAGLKLIRVGNEFTARCPFHDERTPSFTIYDSGRRFHCFGCGASGDVLDFVRLKYGVGLDDAVVMLGSAFLPAVDVQPLPCRKKVEKIVEAKAIWRSAKPVQGTLAETYLRSRGLHLPLPRSIRFAELPLGRHGPLYPVLVAAVVAPDNRLIGIQRTYLNDAGTSKAAVSNPKLSLGRVSGGAIRLAPCTHSVIVCEGLEDGLTLMQELDRPVWVAAGAGNMCKMQFPDSVKVVSIGGDADGAGKQAAQKAADAFLERGMRARTFFPTGAKDFNDELQGKVGR